MTKKRSIPPSATASQEKKDSLSKMSGKPLWMALSAVLVICFFSFYPSLNNSFINWDDNAHVFDNPQLKEPLPKALSYYFGPHTIIGNYIPLTMTVYLLEYKMAGLDPGFFHGVNLLLHLINIVLVYFFIRRLSNGKHFVALFVALFFGLHPMHVESVAWVSELKDLLYTLFFIWALTKYLSYLENKKSGNPKSPLLLYQTLVLFILSLLAKPAAIITPLVLLLLDYYKERKLNKWSLLEKAPFFVLSIVAGYIALRAQSADRLLHNDYQLVDRFFFSAFALCNYLFKFFIPFQQSIFYPYPLDDHGRLSSLVYLAPLLCLVLAYWVYRQRKSSALLTFGALFFLVNLILVLQFVSFGDAFMAERYTYVPYIGLLYIIGMTGEQLFEKKKHTSIGKLILPVCLLLSLVFSYLTFTRCKIWKDDYTMASDLVKKHPNDWLSLNNMGYILFEQKRYNDAVGYFQRALSYKPNYVRASINLSSCFIQLNNPQNALVVTDSALTRNPKNHYLLANKANILFRKFNRFEEASRYFEEAIQMDGKNLGLYLDLSECYYAMKSYDKALATVNKGLVIFPDNHVLFNNKGYLFFLKGNYTAAVEQYKMALKLMPGFQLAKENLDACTKAMNTQ